MPIHTKFQNLPIKLQTLDIYKEKMKIFTFVWEIWSINICLVCDIDPKVCQTHLFKLNVYWFAKNVICKQTLLVFTVTGWRNTVLLFPLPPRRLFSCTSSLTCFRIFETFQAGPFYASVNEKSIIYLALSCWFF